MNKQTVYEDDSISVWFYPDEKIVHHKIRKFVYGDSFRTALTKAADVFLESGCARYLSDDQSSSALREEDIAWADENWQPRMVSGGFRFWAMVMPSKVIGQIPIKPIIERYKSRGVTVQTFDNTDDAFTWLLAQS